MDKVLLITGASSDIGKEYMKQYCQKYDYIFFHYNSDFMGKSELLDEIGQEKMSMIQANLADEIQLNHMLETIIKSGKTVTHFIHLPSLPAENKRFHKMGWETFEKNMEVSFKSAVIILQKIIPQMVKMKYGRIVLMLSYTIETQPILKYLSAYVTTKYALLGLIRSLSAEYASKNITINGVSPAMINTKFIQNMPDLIVQKRIEESPLNRNLEVEDVLPTIHYLLTDEAKCITGENIRITAGN